jgi:hypothetical protein
MNRVAIGSAADNRNSIITIRDGALVHRQRPLVGGFPMSASGQ